MPKELQIQIIRKRIERLVREGSLPDIALEIDLESLVDPTLTLPENWRRICEELGVDPRFPSIRAPKYWSKMDALLPELVRAYEETLFEEQAMRFQDFARLYGLPDSIVDFFMNAIRNREISLADAMDIVTKYRDKVQKWIEECGWDSECILRKYEEEEKKMARERDRWVAVVEMLKNVLSEEEKEILLDPYLPEDVKLALLEERGYVDLLKQMIEKKEAERVKAPPKPAPPPKAPPKPPEKRLPPPPPEKKAPPKAPPAKPRDVHALIMRRLEEMGYRVGKIWGLFEIQPGKYYTVMFQDARTGKWHYVHVRL